MLKPKYAQNIIVGIKTSDDFSWYITERDVWILDINKYSIAYRSNGYEFNMEFALSLRNNISVVNENNYKIYLDDYSNNIVSSSDLRELILKKEYDTTILELKPSLFLDFTEKKLLSMYPEPLPYEKYVPDNWYGSCEEFCHCIYEEDRYWIVCEEDIISKVFEEEKEKFKGE
ncbi:hypothetical protein [Bacillus bingmayongensis]|uniref:hypothetical protein n=1 Tax=Bacillus bingmayongensis TaxID=1150157 RepID=UPI0002F3351E|nr:hypothetical protein [Bacillus bingmayongensis]MBY0595213.1 hypothetical protein [Bacillus bingmayongensis]